MLLADLLEAARAWQPTEKDMQEFEARIEKANKEFEKESALKVPSFEWYNQGYTL